MAEIDLNKQRQPEIDLNKQRQPEIDLNKERQPEIDLNKQRHAALQVLHPLCVSMMKDISKENTNLFLAGLAETDGPILQEIQQYVLFPIQSALRVKNLSESLLCGMCEALTLILKKTKMMDITIFFNVFNSLMFSLTQIEDPNKVSKLSEDTKAAIIEAVDSLLRHSSEKVLTSFYSFENLPAIGQMISVLLSLAQVERARSIQVSALDCLLVLLQTGTKYGKTNEVHLGNMFAFCLPGVTMATSKIITGDSKQGHLVVTRALKVWKRMIMLVMSDATVCKAQEELTNPQTKSSVENDPILERLQSLNVKRDVAWVKATGSKLHILIGQICKLVSDSSWKVRASLAETAEQILMSCCGSLADSVPILLETLVGLINDSYRNVARKAQAALEAFAGFQSGKAGERTLVHILEENLHNLATSMPRQIKMSDEEDKPALIRLLNGYLSILGPKINCVIESSPHLQRLCLALLQALEMDTSNISLVEERMSLLHEEPEVFTDLDTAHNWQPRKYFKHFRDEAVLLELLQACRQLGRYGNVCTLVDHLLDLFQESSVYRLAAVLVINEVVVGAGGSLTENRDSENTDTQNTPELLNSVVRTLLDEYLSPTNLRLMDRFRDGASSVPLPVPSMTPLESSLVVVRADSSWAAQKDVVKKNEAVLLVSLFMEGVAKIASVLKAGFQNHLIQALYPLVENLGHENSHISSSAYAALVEVAVACGHSSLDSLICHNADYLVGSLSLRLRHFEENQRSPRTFCVVLRYSTHDVLPLVSHSITQLLESIDDNYMEDLVSFLPVLLELMLAIGRWFPAKQREQKPEATQSDPGGLILDPHVYAYHFVDRIRTRQEAMGLDPDGGGERENDGQRKMEERSLNEIKEDWEKLMKEQKKQAEAKDDDEEEVVEEKKREAPQHVEIVKQVLGRVRNLLNSKDGRLRIQALDIVSQACRNLADHEKELLPQVHDLWCGLIPLFHSQESFIVIKALKTLLVMAELSGDFIKQRTMKDVVPPLVQFMEKQVKISSHSRSAYTHTSLYKLQVSVLSSLGPLARNLDVDSNGLDKIARVCLPYLSDHQPAMLQKASQESFREFISINSDAMWLLLCQTYCPSLPVNKCGQLTPVKFLCDYSSKNSFQGNITELFQQHFSS